MESPDNGRVNFPLDKEQLGGKVQVNTVYPEIFGGLASTGVNITIGGF